MATKRKRKKHTRSSTVSRKSAPLRAKAAPVSRRKKQTAPAVSSTPPLPSPPSKSSEPAFKQEIPSHYNETYLRVMPRDAAHFFSFWEMTPKTLGRMKKTYPTISLKTAYPNLRVYEVRYGGGKQHVVVEDIPVKNGEMSRYIRVPNPGSTYKVELGLRKKSGAFVPMCGSDTVTLPSARIQAGEPMRQFKANTEALLQQSLLGGPFSGHGAAGALSIPENQAFHGNSAFPIPFLVSCTSPHPFSAGSAGSKGIAPRR